MPKVSTQNVAQAIYDSVLDKTDEALSLCYKNAVNVLDKMHLMSKSEEILNKLQNIIDKENDVLRIKVISQKKIDKDEEKEIEDFIKKRQKVKSIIIDNKIDESVIEGFRIEIGDEVIDNTLKSQLEKLKIHLNK